MLRRPLILKLFAIFLLLEPFLRTAFISIESEFDYLSVLQRTIALGSLDFFNYWFLFPVSGLLLLSVKLYSYIAFISIQLYSLYFHLNYEPYSWPYLDESPSMTAYTLLCFNVFMMMYLLLPTSREVFFDKNLRWWERASRYTLNEPCFITFKDQQIHGKVIDISFGGALLQLDDLIESGSEIKIDFDILGKNVPVDAQVVRVLKGEDDSIRYGTQFLFSNIWEKLRLRMLMLSVSKVDDYEKYR